MIHDFDHEECSCEEMDESTIVNCSPGTPRLCCICEKHKGCEYYEKYLEEKKAVES